MVRIREEERILVGENSRRLIERNTMFSLVLRILRCIPLDLRWYHIYSIPTMPLLRNRYFECFCPANAQVKPRAPSENKASRQLQPVDPVHAPSLWCPRGACRDTLPGNHRRERRRADAFLHPAAQILLRRGPPREVNLRLHSQPGGRGPRPQKSP